MTKRVHKRIILGGLVAAGDECILCSTLGNNFYEDALMSHYWRGVTCKRCLALKD